MSPSLDILLTADLYDSYLGTFQERSPSHYRWVRAPFSKENWQQELSLDSIQVIVSRNNLTAAEYDRLPRLKLLQIPIAGYESIDLGTARQRGVLVGCGGGSNARAVAEHALLLMLGLLRQWKEHQDQIQTGTWRVRKYDNGELLGRQLGIVGLGYCGKALAQCALGMGLKVSWLDIAPPDPVPSWLTDTIVHDHLQALMESVDIVSLHVPLTNHTRGMINAHSLKWMQPDSILINTSRGGVVDEQALVKALDQGTLAGAGLDVFSEEPLSVDSPLVYHPRVIATPHCAPSRESQRRLVDNILANCQALEKGEALPYPAKDYSQVGIGNA